ncbi:von Willebrand factor A domain-containing protein 5A-like [Python bivittatus]|uniref:von Willebrand factor A domain-containing protein 5A-like n=1 Tax=Python bivittatus TaxID=176946 RepID=A0A9F2WG99_PYTBI|nr:von Willebrand factor A domain-containing protein 5A-like [Python bivittatus]
MSSVSLLMQKGSHARQRPVQKTAVLKSGTFEAREPEPSDAKEEESPLLKLVSLQNADGSWPHGSALATLLGLSEAEISDKAPAHVAPDIWATVLAILWLHLNAAEQKDEWELLEGKAVHWLQVNAGVQLAKCVKAGNAVLRSRVSRQVFEL